jgi:hypothetical protein
VATVRGYLFTGRAGGAWNGPGINSSYAAAHPGYGLGYSDIGGVIRIVPTLAADANLDRTVDFNDLVALAQNYNITDGTKTWAQGDFNYDGNVDFNDLVLLAQNYNTTAAALAASLGLKAPAAPKVAPITAPAPVKPVQKTVSKPQPVAKSLFSTVTVAKPQKAAPAKRR